MHLHLGSFCRTHTELIAFFSFFLSPNQKAFHSDIASVIRQRLQEEEALLEDQRPTLQAMSHYVEVSTPFTIFLIAFNVFFRDPDLNSFCRETCFSSG